MAEVGHIIYEDTAAKTEATTTWDSGPTPPFASGSLTANDDYILIVQAGVGSSVAGNNFPDSEFRMFDQTSQMPQSFMKLESRNANNQIGHHYGWLYKYTVPGSPVNLDFDLRVSTTANSVTASRNWLQGLAINLSDLDAADHAYDADSTGWVNLSSASWTSTASITIGDGSSDYLILAFAHVKFDDTSDDFRMVIDVGGTDYSEVQIEAEDAADEHCIMTGKVLSAVASSTTAAVEIRSTGGVLDVDETRIFAIRLDAFEDHALASNTTPVGLPLDTATETENLTHTAATALTENWCSIGFMQANADTNNDRQIRSNLTYDIGGGENVFSGNIASGALRIAHNGTADLFPIFNWGEIPSVADTTSIDIDMSAFEDKTATPEGSIDEGWITAFTWELAPAAPPAATEFVAPHAQRLVRRASRRPARR